ncbi:hypothetical protein [Nocardioides sp. AE5]|uniref:hypothetical protein n=1 Tax=Nocardioides sp. AE5 TaxID=2962573 RepID=UPI002882796E|nr:hypothetical protein [Nocardioides sp. AE5]MDT0202396.1 hypothetical protein [Nocardioides sp. AE5]
MGLFDKIKGALSAPDHTETLRARVGDDGFQGYAAVMASATEDTGPKKSVRDLTDLAQKGAHKLIDGAVQNRHIGGDEGSIGRSMPRTAEPMLLALSERSVTLWRFRFGAKKTDPDLVVRIPREQVTSIEATGKRTARGHVRLSFADGSFFDEQLLSEPAAEFWAAADGSASA